MKLKVGDIVRIKEGGSPSIGKIRRISDNVKGHYLVKIEGFESPLLYSSWELELSVMDYIKQKKEASNGRN